MNEAVVGIDGGATRTRAVLAAFDGRVLGYGQGGPSNYDDVGIISTRQNVSNAIHQALHEAGHPTPEIKAVFLGMAGVVSQSDRNIILEIASGIPGIQQAALQVDHDLRIALAGGLIGEPGIVLIAGTGSSCYGTNSKGLTLRVGGWGHLLDDVGSSYFLGLQAIINAARAADGRIPPTLLTAKVLQRLEIPDVQHVMWRVYHKGLQPAEIAALAPLVIDAAEEGDTASLQIISKGVSELALLAQTAAQRLGYCNEGSLEQESLRVVLSGGLVKSSRFYRGNLLTAIHEKLPHAQTLPPILPPAFGAALLALNASGVSTNPELVEALQDGAIWAASTGDLL
jgi:N-acetylglucosamine kinase